MSPEVLIYVQNVKTYLKNNKEAHAYFLSGIDEELFFKHLADISQKNLDKDGEAMLNNLQFELLRTTLKVVSISKKEYKEDHSHLFVKVKGFGQYSLN